MSTARSLSLIALCGLIGSSARPQSQHAPATHRTETDAPIRRAMPHGARIHRDAPVVTGDASAVDARAELARLLREAPEEDLRAIGSTDGSLLTLFPLDKLRGARRGANELVLEFETGAAEALEVDIPERITFAMDVDTDGEDPERAGRAIRMRSEARVLLVHRLLRFRLDEHGIAGVRAGDLEVRAGPFAVDLDLRTERRSGPARDRFGRPLIALDEHGAPIRRDGRWSILKHERWIVLEALGHRVEVGW